MPIVIPDANGIKYQGKGEKNGAPENQWCHDVILQLMQSQDFNVIDN